MGTTALLEVSHMYCDLLSELQNCEIDLRFRKTACMVWQLISGAVFMIIILIVGLSCHFL